MLAGRKVQELPVDNHEREIVTIPNNLGIIGIVFSKKARNNYCSNAFRILGFIISLIMLIVGAIALTIMFFTFVIAGAVLSEFIGALFG